MALTVAGSDSGGGAGIQADLKTFAALEVYGLSAVTAVTAQSTSEVRGVHFVPAAFVKLQLETLLDDFSVDVLKTGMLGDADTIAAVGEIIEAKNLTAVVDPVFGSSGGHALTTDLVSAIEAMKRHLLPRAHVFMPNLDEVGVLLGKRPDNEHEMIEAARALLDLGADGVLVKGGHLLGDPHDVFLEKGGQPSVLSLGPRIESASTHGTGCTLAAATAAHLALGRRRFEAIVEAKRFVERAIAAAPKIPELGRGPGPLHHFFRFYPWGKSPT
jgi:hydroxymethylpyrimidine/phosphomethylpyrimidine kinase